MARRFGHVTSITQLTSGASSCFVVIACFVAAPSAASFMARNQLSSAVVFANQDFVRILRSCDRAQQPDASEKTQPHEALALSAAVNHGINDERAAPRGQGGRARAAHPAAGALELA